MTVKWLREQLHLANSYRAAAKSLVWGEYTDGVNYVVCACGARRIRDGKQAMVHTADCVQMLLRIQADRIEAGIESRIESGIDSGIVRTA